MYYTSDRSTIWSTNIISPTINWAVVGADVDQRDGTLFTVSRSGNVRIFGLTRSGDTFGFDKISTQSISSSILQDPDCAVFVPGEPHQMTTSSTSDSNTIQRNVWI